MGENRWRDLEEWPPPTARATPLYLASGGDARTAAGDGALVWEPPVGGAAADRYRFDPREPVWDERFEDPGPHEQTAFAGRDDTLVYTSAPLQRDIDVIGEIEAELHVSIDRPDTDLAVALVDVYPDGRSYNVMGPEAGYLRLRYRQGFEQQVPMPIGRPVRVRVGNMLTAQRFLAGHRIRVQITSSRAPHFDPNPNTGGEIATDTRLLPAEVTLWHDADRPSRLLLPIVPVEEEE